VREAGGVATDFEGGERILETGSIVAANAALHGVMLDVMRASRARS
jgi:myo-inositol-1(or 4)-monophosphatase